MNEKNALTSEYMAESVLLRLRMAAQKFGVTEISRITGLQRAHIYKALSDEGNPTLEVLTKIAAALSVKLELKQFNPAEIASPDV